MKSKLFIAGILLALASAPALAVTDDEFNERVVADRAIGNAEGCTAAKVADMFEVFGRVTREEIRFHAAACRKGAWSALPTAYKRIVLSRETTNYIESALNNFEVVVANEFMSRKPKAPMKLM